MSESVVDPAIDDDPMGEEEPRARHSNPLLGVPQAIYRFLYSKVWGVIVILVMAILTLLGTMIMQMPASVAADPDARGQWLAEAAPRYGGWTAVFDKLGFFTLWRSPLFLIVTAWLTLSIIACTTHRIPNLLQQTLHPRVNVSRRYFERAQYRANLPVECAPDTALDIVTAQLKRRGFRIIAGDDGRSLYSDKFRWGPWGTVVAHASFVIIIVAFVISAFFGLSDAMYIGVGQRAAVGHNTGLEVEVKNFTDSYDAEGRPTDYVSDVVAYRNGQQVAHQEVRVNTPLVVDGTRFHQESFGIAADVSVTADNNQIFSGSVPLRYSDNSGQYSIGRQDLDAFGISVVTPASGKNPPDLKPGRAIIELYDRVSGKVLLSQQVGYGESVTYEKYTVTMERERPYTGLMVRRDPGAPLLWLGSILLIVGMSLTFGLRPRRIWARADQVDDETVVSLGASEKPNIMFERDFRTLARDVEQAAKEHTHA